MTEDEGRSPWEEKGEDLDRILSLSDGVFGFSLTLLASGIGVPALSRVAASTQLSREILSLVPQFGVYALTFYFVIIKWMVHRRIFSVITRYDSTLIWLNNVFLLLIAFMPVPSRILVDYVAETSAVVFFALMHAITTVTQEAMWVYATKGHRLVAPDLDEEWIRYSSLRNLVQIGVMAASIGIALISPVAAVASWFLAGFANIVAARRVRLQPRHYRVVPQDHKETD